MVTTLRVVVFTMCTSGCVNFYNHPLRITIDFILLILRRDSWEGKFFNLFMTLTVGGWGERMKNLQTPFLESTLSTSLVAASLSMPSPI